MITLGIETTCDETGIALVRDGRVILANLVASQLEHERFGGVVPELSARLHLSRLRSLLKEALSITGLSLEEIDCIAVAHGPGLIGALHVGVQFAKGLALGLHRPLVGVNHVAAHLYVPFMGEEPPPLPAIGLVVSGAHTALVRMDEPDLYHLLGQTHDDAVGEAFDKVARLLGLPYPGGPAIEALALKGDPSRYPFKAGRIEGRPLDFSYSGLKTAVLTQIQRGAERLADLAASFQQCALLPLVQRATLAAKQEGAASIVVGGGVSANQRLRALFTEHCPLPTFFPPKGLSVDNGAMIAGLGTQILRRRGADALDLQPLPRIAF